MASDSSLAWPPYGRRLSCRDRLLPQCHELPALDPIAADLRAVLTGHPALKLMDRRRRLWPPHDREVHRGMQIATGTANLEIAEARVERITQHWGGLSRPLETEHAIGPSFAGKDVSFASGIPGALRRRPDRRGINVFPRFRAHAEKVAGAMPRVQPLGLGVEGTAPTTWRFCEVSVRLRPDSGVPSALRCRCL